jgi:hypothetical protein
MTARLAPVPDRSSRIAIASRSLAAWSASGEIGSHRGGKLRHVSVFMRAVVRDWTEPSFADAATFVASHSPFRLQSPSQTWSDFEAVDATGETVLAADVWTGEAARGELAELEEFLDELDGDDGDRDAVRQHLREADAVVGMQVLMSRYDDSVSAANAIVDYLEQRPGVLTQVDTVGWYDGPELVLREPG